MASLTRIVLLNGLKCELFRDAVSIEYLFVLGFKLYLNIGLIVRFRVGLVSDTTYRERL